MQSPFKNNALGFLFKAYEQRLSLKINSLYIRWYLASNSKTTAKNIKFLTWKVIMYIIIFTVCVS